MSEFDLIFEKWQDPCESLLNDSEEDEDELPGDKFDRRKNKNLGPYIVGPMGYMPINEGNIPSKLHNLWVCHTNFRLEEYMLKIIELVNGVESLDVITPYRFRFSVAKMFDEKAVKKVLKDKLITSVTNENDRVPVKVKIMANMLKIKHPFWAIVQAGDVLVHYTGKTIEEVENLLDTVPENVSVQKIYRSWVDKV